MEKICGQITVAAFMQPLQYDLRDPAAKDTSITNAATARSNLDAAITMRSAETELQNTIELRATASEIVAPKPDLDARAKKDDFEALFKRIFRRKIISAKMEKICWQITVAAFMQPLQYDLRDPAAKDTSITNAATARSNLDAAITMRSAETELQNTIELRATVSEIVAPKTELQTDPIYIAGTILQLQSTMEFHRQLIHQHHLQSHLHCGNDPTVANHNGILSTAHARKKGETPFTVRNRSDHDPTTHETVSQPSHRRGRSSRFGDGLCMEKHRVSFVHLLSLKNAFRARLPSKLHRQLLHQHHLQCHLHCGNDPTVAKHNGIPSATHPPAPLAIPFTLRERSYSCKSQWNSVDRTCTKKRWNPIYSAEPIRPWSDHTRDRLATVAPQR